MSPTAIYLLMEKVHALFSRGADISARKIGSNQVEIVAIPKAGVNEQPYQCQNRTGMFESIARLFTDNYARIDHSSCVHQGGDRCRYLITWVNAPKIHWKLMRNYALLLSIVILAGLIFSLPFEVKSVPFLAFRVGITQSNMSTPCITASTTSSGVPTPMRYTGLSSGRNLLVSEITLDLVSRFSPTESPPKA